MTKLRREESNTAVLGRVNTAVVNPHLDGTACLRGRQDASHGCPPVRCATCGTGSHRSIRDQQLVGAYNLVMIVELQSVTPGERQRAKEATALAA